MIPPRTPLHNLRTKIRQNGRLLHHQIGEIDPRIQRNPRAHIRNPGIVIQDCAFIVEAPICNFLQRGYVCAVVASLGIHDSGVEVDDGGKATSGQPLVKEWMEAEAKVL